MKRKLLLILVLIAIVAAVFVIMPAAADTVVYSQGFETDNGGYTHFTDSDTADQWQWGIPTFADGPSAHNGAKCWGTNLAGVVPEYTDSYLTSPTIHVPTLGSNEMAQARFYGWISIDNMEDRGEFSISNDGGNTWVTMAEFFNEMQGGWTQYCFNLTEYSGQDIKLRFRLATDDWYDDEFNMAGFYVDDIAVTTYTVPATRTLLTLDAYEESGGSCPWVYSWDGSGYVAENDIYSTARGADKEYVDYYTLKTPVVSKDGQYSFHINEVMDESSWTDMVKLITVDHAAGVKISNDEKGNIWTYSSPAQPASAVNSNGNNVLGQVSVQDNAGVKLYNGNYVLLDFSNLDISQGATLVLSAKGFLSDADVGKAIAAPPRIFIQTQDDNGNWVNAGWFYPRMDMATNAYNLAGKLTHSKLVRLYATSCNEGKYHLLDYVGLDTAPQAHLAINTVSPVSAASSVSDDILGAVSTSDNSYATMAAGQSMSLTFPAPAMSGTVRDMVFVSEGYYIPMGTFFIYTWDGTGWAQRDAWSVNADFSDEYNLDARLGASNGFQSHTFDLSPWLPDPNGAYKVRVWQDYIYEDAGIDYAQMSRGATEATLDSAFDLQYGDDVTEQLSDSDGYADEWNSDMEVRNRWVQINFTGLGTNNPPTALISVNGAAPTISWTYSDPENNPQTGYEVEVWTGANGLGSILWDPAAGSGASTSVTYSGAALTEGQTYYARVKVTDGNSWGGWSEKSFVAGAGTPTPTYTPPISVPNPYGIENAIVYCNGTTAVLIYDARNHTVIYDARATATPAPTPVPTPVITPTSVPATPTPTVQPTATAVPATPTPTPTPASGDSGSVYLWLVGFVVVVIAIAGGYWLFFRQK